MTSNKYLITTAENVARNPRTFVKRNYASFKDIFSTSRQCTSKSF